MIPMKKKKRELFNKVDVDIHEELLHEEWLRELGGGGVQPGKEKVLGEGYDSSSMESAIIKNA